MHVSLRAWVLLGVLSCLWGGSFLFTRVSVQELTPLMVVALRLWGACLVLWCVVMWRGLSVPANWKRWSAFLVASLLSNVLPFSLISWAQLHLTAGVASILNATTPLFGVLLAGFFLADESLTPTRLVGVLIGILGVSVLVAGPQFMAGSVDLADSSRLVGSLAQQGDGKFVMASLAVLTAALCYALAGIFSRRFLGLHPLVAATGQLSCSSLVMLLACGVGLAQGQSWMKVSAGDISLLAWGCVLGLALLSTALANLLYFQLLGLAGATFGMMVTFLIPLVAVLLGWVLLGERLSMIQGLGMGLIILSLLVTTGMLTHRLRHQKA